MKNIIEKLNAVIAPWEDYSFSSSKKTFNQRILENLKILYLWSQREFAIRYLPAISEIKNKPNSYSILEVGSGAVGLARYTKRKVVGVDINTKGPNFENMEKINAKAWNLPFENNEFDCVISIDMLEHIPRQYRQKVISEFIRVARNEIIFTFPSGKDAERWEGKMRSIYEHIIKNWPNKKLGKEAFILRNSFLTEHFEHQLPKVDEILDYIKENDGILLDMEIFDNESCYVWYWGVLGHMKHSYFRWMITTLFFILFFPILANCKWGGTYRKVFKLKKENK
jgi:SAM-dependent methyltransferase